MRTQKQVLTRLVEWARGNDVVRAVILTSTRANPERETDFLSDHDVELYVTDVEPFRKDDRWLEHFGQVMVRWPYRPRAGHSKVAITRLVIFRDRVRMDFQIHEQSAVPADAYDDDYMVLLDKDGILAHLAPPTHTEH